MINPLAFACQIAEGVPGSSALYLATSDLLVPNQRWNKTLGNMSRLGDLARLPNIDIDELRDKIIAMNAPENAEFSKPLDDDNIRSLVITALPNLPQMFFIFLRDETAAHRLTQMRRDFIANVSHELKTPLAVVRGYVETLMDTKFQTPEYLAEFLPLIQENTERMNTLVVDLLDLSRLETEGAMKLVPISLKSEIIEAVDITTDQAQERNINIEVRNIDTAMVSADSTSFQRVLINLLENAIKYTPAGGNVTVETEITSDFDENKYVTVHIRDTGLGIAPEDQERIFTRFYRIRQTSPDVRGSGLGLAIVKHALQLMGTEIQLDSTPNQGSDFYFSMRVLAFEK